MNKKIVAISALILGSVSMSAFAYGSMHHNNNYNMPHGSMHTNMMQNQGMCMGMKTSHHQTMMQGHQNMYGQGMMQQHQNMHNQTMMQHHQSMHASDMMSNSAMPQ